MKSVSIALALSSLAATTNALIGLMPSPIGPRLASPISRSPQPTSSSYTSYTEYVNRVLSFYNNTGTFPQDILDQAPSSFTNQFKTEYSALFQQAKTMLPRSEMPMLGSWIPPSYLDGPESEGIRRLITKIERSNTTLAVEAKRRHVQTGSKSRAGFQFTVDGTPRMNFQYFNRDSDSLDLFRIRIALLSLIEVNGTVNPIQSRNRLMFNMFPKHMWTPIEISEEDAGNNSTIRHFKTSLLPKRGIFSNPMVDKFDGMNFTLAASMADADVNKPGLQLSPDSVKYSVYINGWNQMYDDSSILLTKAIWSSDNSIQLGEDGQSVDLAGGNGRFRWISNITVDGNEHELKIHEGLNLAPELNTNFTTKIDGLKNALDTLRVLSDFGDASREGTEAKMMGFLLKTGESIAWDPEFGCSPFLTTDNSTIVDNEVSGENQVSGGVSNADIMTTSVAIATATPSVNSTSGNSTTLTINELNNGAGSSLITSSLALISTVFALLI